MRKRNPDKKQMWALRLDPPLFSAIKRKGRKAAPWVRELIYDAIKGIGEYK
jgi:hypothetical protein